MSKIIHWIGYTRGGDAVCAVFFTITAIVMFIHETHWIWTVVGVILIISATLCAVNAIFNVTRKNEDDFDDDTGI